MDESIRKIGLLIFGSIIMFAFFYLTTILPAELMAKNYMKKNPGSSYAVGVSYPPSK